MKKGSIGVIRGIFDPVHKGHIEGMVSAFDFLTISKLHVIVKFIGDKDPAASLKQRIEMIKLHLNKYNIPVDVLRQNIKGHVAELIDLSEKYAEPIINICGSDKAACEMQTYGHAGDTFGVIYRNDFQLMDEAHQVAQEKGIELIEIIPAISTSSTHVRNLLLQDQTFQDGLDPDVSKYISANGLYIPDNSHEKKERFLFGWRVFIEKLSPLFPNLALDQLKPPLFKPTQDESCWLEKYIRTIVSARRIKNDELLTFVTEAEKVELL